MSEYTEYLARAERKYGDKWDASSLSAQFAPYFAGRRIRVTTTYGTGPDAETYTRTGTVGVTSGWRPAFLLMHRSSDHGSSDVLSNRDTITHVQYGRTYLPVANLYTSPVPAKAAI